ncbi:MAG: hypothetical protein DRI46_11950 [Chloroflexi bacterium]|nr:MAG: hypothetical protein DRI46_11950 [Chloroflexota bacterium]
MMMNSGNHLHRITLSIHMNEKHLSARMEWMMDAHLEFNYHQPQVFNLHHADSAFIVMNNNNQLLFLLK